MTTWNRPVPFPGSPEEAARNFHTHTWRTYDRDEPPECDVCCAKSWHVAASYECGVEVPREIIVIGRTEPTLPPRRDLD